MDNYLGYRKKTKEEIEFLWKNAIFTFDTNSLLNLYRYSPTSRKDIFEIINKISTRIFLTNQVTFEFNKNRYENINNLIKNHNDFVATLEKINNEIISKSSSPLLSKTLSVKFETLLEQIKFEIQSKSNNFLSLFNDDPIYNELKEIFKDKVLEEFDETQMSKILKDGETRYSQKIPPGYSDGNKQENKFGDLIIWKEIINFAKSANKPIIFISDDRKDDWIWKLKDGKIIGPRPELIQEFYKETNQLFHIYKSENFIKYGSEFLNEQLDAGTIEEVTKISKEIRLSEFQDFLTTLSDDEINERLKILSPREADFLRLNLGFGGKHRLNAKEISETFDIDLSTALSIKSNALRKLKNAELGK